MGTWPRGNNTLLGQLPDAHRADLETEEVHLEPGLAFPGTNSRGRYALYVRTGRVEVERDGVADAVGAGSAAGEASLVLGHEEVLQVRALEPSILDVVLHRSFDGVMKSVASGVRDSLVHQASQQQSRRELATLLRRHFPLVAANPGRFDDLLSAVSVIQPAGGEVLCRAGDVADAMYFVVRGRLRVVDDEGVTIATLGAGDVVGERALLTGERRNRTVVVARTATLGRIGREEFDTLSLQSTEFFRQLATSVVEHARSDKAHASTDRIVAVVPLVDSPSVRWAVDALAEEARRLSSPMLRDSDVEAGVGLDPRQLDEPDALVVERWLDSQQPVGLPQWLDAGHGSSAWSRVVCGRADKLVFVVDASKSSEPTQLEQELAQFLSTKDIALILVHPKGTRLPSGTRAWLERRSLTSHHHVEAGHPGDCARAVRLLSGRGVGVVMAGGGALGAAHVGAVAALLEAGVPIDYLGGTSSGGGLSAAFALYRSFDEAHQAIVAQFVEENIWRKPTLPYMSMVRMSAVDGAARAIYGDATVEDLWIPWFGVAASIRSGEAVVVRKGDVWRAVRATSSIPGLIAPMIIDGDELVDGGILNNFPAEIMKSLCAGPIIGLDLLSTPNTATELTYGDLPTGRDVVRSWARRRALPRRLPTIRHVFMQLAVLGNKRNISDQKSACALYVKPNLRGFAMFDYVKFGEIARIGYDTLQEALSESNLSDLVVGWSNELPRSHLPPRAARRNALGKVHERVDGEAVLRPPVSAQFGEFSLGPLKTLKEVLNGLTPGLRAARASTGSPIFETHIGQSMVVVTEARSADFVFRAPTSLLDRGAPRTFGPIGVRPELVRVEPLLTANEKTHRRLAAFIDAVLAERAPAFESELLRTMDAVFAEWVQQRRVPLLEGLRDLVARACVSWLLGVSLRSGDVNAFLANVFEPLPSGLVASRVAKAASRCPHQAVALADDLHAMALESPYRARLQKLASDAGVEGPLDHMLFMALFNAAGGASGVLMPAILEVDRSPALRAWVDGEEPLDDLVLEAHRLYGRPVLFSRVALQDVAIPSSAGAVHVRAGSRITVAVRMCQTDPLVFDDPQRFDPHRYQRAPRSRDFVFSSGAPSGAQSGYRCRAADLGIQFDLVALVLRHLTRRLEWQASVEPVFDEQFDLYVGPKDLELTGVRWREGAR